MSAQLENLTTEQLAEALRWHLHWMSTETRAQFMAEMPITYARLYPTVSTGVIADRVQQALSADRDAREAKSDWAALQADVLALAPEVLRGPETPPKVYYVQVRPSPRGKLLTYASDYPVAVGEHVELPPLPWMRGSWPAEVEGTERGDYPGYIYDIIGRA